jgi:hypothetical protein
MAGVKCKRTEGESGRVMEHHLRMKELEEGPAQAGTVSFLGLSKPNATE